MGRQLDLISLNNSLDATPFRFTLSNDFYGEHVLKYAPDGYLPEQFQFTRSMEHFGVFRKFTQNELKFVKDGRDYLQNCYESFGVNADVTLKVEALNPDTLTYSEKFTGTIDFSTYKINEIAVSVQVIDGMFIQKILNREGVKVNLLSSKSIDGNYIGLAIPKNIIIPEVSIIQSANYSGVVDQYVDDHIAPITIVNSEYTEAFTPEQGNNYLTNSFFRNALEAYNLNFSGHVKVKISFTSDELSHYAFYFHIVRYGSTGVYKDEVILFEISGQGDPGVISVDELIDSQLSVVEGDYLTFKVSATTLMGLSVYYDYEAINFSSNNIIAAVPSKTIKGVPYHEAFERLVAQLTGEINMVHSTIFGRTDLGYSMDGIIGGITTGHFIRGLDQVNPTIPASLKDLFGSLSLYNIGIGEVSGKLRIEPMKFWFDDHVVLDLSQRIAPETIQKEIIPELLANALKIGFSSFEYDRTGGIYEYNTQSQFSTVLLLDNSFQIVSQFRADMTGILKILQETEPTKDSKEDSGVFMLDCIRDSVDANDFIVRTNEGFDYAVGGTDTAENFNLLLTPARTLRRWGSYIRAMMDKYQDQFIRWQTSDKSTTLKTKLTSENFEVSESGDVKVGTLDVPLWHPEKYIVNSYVTREELDKVTANPLGIVKLADDKFGWILDFKVQNHDFEVELSLLRVNLQYVTPVEMEPLTEINYGLLYNWYAATDVRKITSSDDWDVPTIEIAEGLRSYIDPTGNDWVNIAGGKLKEIGDTYWNGNVGATNDYNFNARGCGYRQIGGIFNGLKQTFRLTTSTIPMYSNDLDYKYVNASDVTFSINSTSKIAGEPYRLYRDATVDEILYCNDGDACDPYIGNDGRAYKTVFINNIVWLAESLAETKYRNGDWIHGFDGGVYTPISNEDWAALTTAACCAYDDDTSNI